MPGPAEHQEAVKADYNRRVRQWQTIYSGTSFHDWNVRVRLERTSALLDGLAPTGAALDVGCGGGQLVALLARRGLETSGTDLAEGMVDATLALLAEEGLEADVRQASADALPFGDASFGLVTALGLIEYLEEPRLAVAEMARVLSPGGHLIVTAPNPVRLAYILDPIGTVMGRVRTPAGGYHRHYFAPRAFRQMLTDAGLAVEHLEGHGLGPLTFARRPLMGDARAIALSVRLQRMLPEALSTWLGANLIAVARKR
jgi:2-polyprenyl-3-methyl-5-hydroxy-6-metoxy-1,4-benzoquinol methylase